MGRISATAVNDSKRFGWLGLTVDNAHEVYSAYQKFIKILRDPKNIVEHKMADGEILTLDNQRVFHGRRGYQPSSDESRTLESGYLDWDEFRSRLHVLAKKLGKPAPYTPRIV